MRISVAPALLLSCTGSLPLPEPAPGSADPAAAAVAFVAEADAGLRQRWVSSEQTGWDYSVNINAETEAASAAAEEELMKWLSTAIPQAAAFDSVPVDARTRRQLDLLKLSANLPAPMDDAKRKELADISTRMEGVYGKGEVCDQAGECRDLGELSEVMAQSSDPEELLDAWLGWRTVSPPIRADYQRFVELANEGATEIGYADVGALWRSKYDMPPADFSDEVDRLFEQVAPLYEQLHCHVRAKLGERYGSEIVPPSGTIPAHLLGNMWAQSWENLYPMLEPYPGQASLDVSEALENTDEKEMVRIAEGFFTSIGLDPLPPTFWERSMFVKPDDRDVVCHASAWDPSYADDLRLKMCIERTMGDLVTIHHELGHNYYYHYYFTEPVVYQQGAHDGFHEAVGDAVALSITPAYLQQIGLLEEVSTTDEAVINKQMADALRGIAFLPFGRMIDQWRYEVFSGAISPEEYNAGWWRLRAKYQGVAPPVARGESDFDPGAKYHIPGNTSYMRYFLAQVLQFQFHRAMCAASGHEGALHTCSVYGSEAAGEKLIAMLSMGAREPWPAALEAIAGSREMDATALVTYFQPLMTWLEHQNEGRQCGW